MTTNLQISYISDSEPFNASVANRPIQELANYVSSVKTTLDSMSSRCSLKLDNQLVNPALSVGDIVYYSSTSRRFEAALCATQITNDMTSSSESVMLVGILETINDELGSIVLQGEYSGPLHFQDAYGGENIYYLSASTPGALIAPIITTTAMSATNTTQIETIKDPLPVSVPVCCITGYTGEIGGVDQYSVIINSQWFNFAQHHKHYKFDLKAAPAGNFTATSDWLTAGTGFTLISGVEGWEPVNNNTSMPAGAKLRYRIELSSFAKVWPPTPVNTSILTWRAPGSNMIGGIPETLCVANDDGIWWMSSSVAPWDTALNFSNGVVVGAETTPLEECVWWTNPVFNTNNLVVESLEPATNSGITIVNKSDGQAAKSGNLIIDLDLNNTVLTEEDKSYVVCKSIQNSGLNYGPVLAGVKLNSNTLAISSVDLATGNTLEANDDGYYSGYITLTDSSAMANTELTAEAVHLQNVRESLIADCIALAFPGVSTSTLLGRVFIPRMEQSSLTTVSGKVRFIFYTLQNTGSFNPSTDFKFYYRIINYPSAVNTPQNVNLNGEWNRVDLPDVTIANTQYYCTLVEVDLTNVSIPLGSIFNFKLTRLQSTDTANNYDIMLLRKTLVLS